MQSEKGEWKEDDRPGWVMAKKKAKNNASRKRLAIFVVMIISEIFLLKILKRTKYFHIIAQLSYFHLVSFHL